MALQFTVTDAQLAAESAAKLFDTAAILESRIRAGSQDLGDLRYRGGTGDPVLSATAALEKWRKKQYMIQRTETELLLLLSDCGASERGLATLMGQNRGTIATRLRRAREEREPAPTPVDEGVAENSPPAGP